MLMPSDWPDQDVPTAAVSTVRGAVASGWPTWLKRGLAWRSCTLPLQSRAWRSRPPCSIQPWPPARELLTTAEALAVPRLGHSIHALAPTACWRAVASARSSRVRRSVTPRRSVTLAISRP